MTTLVLQVHKAVIERVGVWVCHPSLQVNGYSVSHRNGLLAGRFDNRSKAVAWATAVNKAVRGWPPLQGRKLTAQQTKAILKAIETWGREP